jgi:hypothetical protein
MDGLSTQNSHRPWKGRGSFDSVTASLCEAVTAIRMTKGYLGGAVISMAQIAAGRMYMDAR